MEALVGRAVRKEFPGYGVFSGVVESYDAEAGYFRVLYEDGDSEEVDAEEMVEILVGPAMPFVPRTPESAGRRPKKRRRVDEEESAPRDEGGVVLAVPARGGGSSDGEIETAAEVASAPAEARRRDVPAPDSSTPLRRSARQAKVAAMVAEMEAAVAVAAAAEAAEAEAAGTAQQSRRKRSRGNGSARYRSVSRDLEEAAAVERLPPRPELPRSSRGLDLGGLPALDVFQVYSCLRSFSRQLFLSPFPLETFVVALHYTHPNSLIDWVHFSLLRAMKSHLEDCASEGDPSAIHCIRNLNWELLDLATWPIYLAEYLLARGSELRYGMKLTDLKLLTTEYYRQPTAAKLELLRSLSDDVLEIEAIRSRMSESDGNDDGFRSAGARKRKGSSKGQKDSSPLPDDSDDMDDGNSDECYLCGMDGNLLCCDGCPAAFHSKCVGVVEDLLPEGDWYCPECLIQKNDGSRNVANPMRGAEVLGTDPHGRLYFGTYGYLLVVESSDLDSPCHYYGHDDIHSLITLLNACHPSFSPTVNAISLFCRNAIEPSDFNGRYQSSKQCSTSDAESDYRRLSPLKHSSEYEQFKLEQGNSFEQLDSGNFCASNLNHLDHDVSHLNFTSSSALISGSGSKTADRMELDQTSQNRPSSSKNGHCNPQKDDVCSHANRSLKDPLPEEAKSGCHLYSDPAKYINYYSFGQIAALAAVELKHKISENKEGKKPAEDALSIHLRTICKKYANIFALTDQTISIELLKEKCGWCNSCQISSGVDCIFRVTDVKCKQGSKPHTFGPRAERNKEIHIDLAVQNILSLEERLNGLLTGPWQNPQYSDFWRQAILKASDVSSLKQPLLMLESSLRRIAISTEWQKPADSVEVVGSAAHILVRTSSKSLNHVSAKKPGRKPSPNGELKIDSRDVGVYWWRGGTLSRQVFHWKRLPQSLASKAARQAGRQKIPTIMYPDGSQFARRFKYIAWRAAVEMAESAAQLILQIKELEWNIKWTEILSTLPSGLATKETQKTARLFKKAIIRRKRIEGTNVEYLLDFGKRDNIPNVVSKYGKKFEEPSSERTRYWLGEGHVPLNLLKAYEAKALGRLLKKKESDYLPKKTKRLPDSKPKRPKIQIFDYLFEKAKKLSTRLCGQCKKVVVDSEAVNCQYCDALFHRKHFKVPKSAAAVYVCNKCLTEEVLKMESPQKKADPRRTSPRKKQKKQSRKIVTRKNQVLLKYKKKTGKTGKRGRPRKHPLDVSKNASPKKPERERESSNVPKDEPVKRISRRLYEKYMKGNSNKSGHAAGSRKRKRTALRYPYWLNGVRWTHNPDDERARRLRKERVVFPSEDATISGVSPLCCLCGKCYSNEAIYIACEECEDWFHGDIFSITLENVNNIIGFKCHRCRLRGVPVCPYAQNVTIPEHLSDKELNINKFVGDEDHKPAKNLGDHGSQSELHDKIEKRPNGHLTGKDLDDPDCLKKLNGHNNLTEAGSDSNERELEDDRNLKELDAYGQLKELGSPQPEKEADDDDDSLKGLDDQNDLMELDSYKTQSNHNSLSDLDSPDNPKDLDNHKGREELDGNESGRFAAEEMQHMKDQVNSNSLEFDNQNILEENGHNGSYNLEKISSLKEFDGTGDDKLTVTAHSGDFLAENSNNMIISNKQTLITTSETGSVDESHALKSKDDSEKSVPGKHEIDRQVMVTL